MCARYTCVRYVYKKKIYIYMKTYSAGLCTYVSFFRVGIYHYLTIKMNVVTDVEIVDYFCSRCIYSACEMKFHIFYIRQIWLIVYTHIPYTHTHTVLLSKNARCTYNVLSCIIFVRRKKKRPKCVNLYISHIWQSVS